MTTDRSLAQHGSVQSDRGSKKEVRSPLWWVAGLLALLCLFLWVSRSMPAVLGPAPTYGDAASLEIAVVDAAEGSRLLGQPTRFGFHQLGPSHFYLQVPAYLATGRAHWSLSATLWFLSLTSFGALLWILGEHVREWRALVVVAVVAVPYVHYLQVSTLMSSWGQFEIVLPFAVLLAAAAALAAGRTAYAWLVLLLASFVVQGYGSTLPAVAAILTATGIGVWVNRGRHELRHWHVGSTLLVLVALWLPTVVDAVVSDPSNLRRVADHYSHRADSPPNRQVLDSLSVHLAGPWLALASDVRQHAAWPLGPGLTRWSRPLAAAWVLVVLGATLVSWRRRRPYVTTLCALSLVAVALAWLSGRRLDGEPYPYVFLWVSSVGALGWGVGLGELLTAHLAGRPAASRATQLLAFGGAGALAIAVWRPPALPVSGDPAVARLAERILVAETEADQPLHFRAHGQSWIWVVGAMIELHNRGRAVTVQNLQGGQTIPDLQGLLPRWLERRPGSRLFAFHLEGEGAPAEDEKLVVCESIQPLVGISKLCIYEVDRSMAQGSATQITR